MKWFFLSLFLHLILLGWLFLKKEPPAEEVASIRRPVEWIELQDWTKEPKKASKTQGRKGKRKGLGLSLKDLSPSARSFPQSIEAQGGSWNRGGDDLYKADNSSASWGEGGAEYGRIKDFIRMDRVAQAMDALVEFPHPLAYRKMGGVVRVRLVISEDGACNWRHSRIEGNRPELRFYILLATKKLCRGDAWQGYKKRKSSNVDFAFNFDVYGDQREEPRVLGNVIMYSLPGYQIKGEWRLGPIRGNIFMPIGTDATWLVENWNRLMHSKEPLDEFRQREP